MQEISRDKLDQVVRRFEGQRIGKDELIPFAFESTIIQITLDDNSKPILYLAFPRKYSVADVAAALAKEFRSSPHIVQLNVTQSVLFWGKAMARPHSWFFSEHR